MIKYISSRKISDDRYHVSFICDCVEWSDGSVPSSALNDIQSYLESKIDLYRNDISNTYPDGITLEQGKENLNTFINKLRNNLEYGIYTDSNGHRYDIDMESRARITGMVGTIAIGLAPTSFEWRDADNIDRTHTPDTFKVLSGEIFVYTNQIHIDARVKKALVESATTLEELNSIEL